MKGSCPFQLALQTMLAILRFPKRAARIRTIKTHVVALKRVECLKCRRRRLVLGQRRQPTGQVAEAPGLAESGRLHPLGRLVG